MDRETRAKITVAFGQLRRIFTIDIKPGPRIQDGVIQKLVLMVAPVKVFKLDQQIGFRVVSKGEFMPIQFIDATNLLGVAARVIAPSLGGGPDRQTFLSRPGSRAFFGVNFDDATSEEHLAELL
jgi:hypothetical protein